MYGVSVYEVQAAALFGPECFILQPGFFNDVMDHCIQLSGCDIKVLYDFPVLGVIKVLSVKQVNQPEDTCQGLAGFV